MRCWLGLTLLAGGLGLIVSGMINRRRSAVRAHQEDNSASSSLADMAEIVRPLILLALVYVGVKATLVYFAMGGARFLSVFDLASFLFFLGSYGAWLYLRTTPARRREMPPASKPSGPPDEEAPEPEPLRLPTPHRMSA